MSKHLIILLLILSALPVLAQDITVNGRQVTVKTPRYVVEFDGLAIVRVQNLLTGETYAQPPAALQPSKAWQGMSGRAGVAVESLRDQPLKFFGISERTKVETARIPGGMGIRYTGLQYGQGEKAEFDDMLTVTLNLVVEQATGDLLITPQVKGNIPLVAGARDRGIQRVDVQLRNLDESLKVILPINDGVGFTKENVGPDFLVNNAGYWAWPQNWEAALCIVEGAKGCLGFWADEPKLNYGRTIGLCRSDNRWHASFEFETAERIYLCDEIANATWRFNVFSGYWVKAAERYRAQMQKQWPELKPIDQRTPAWADKVRIVIGSSMPDLKSAENYAALAPPDSFVLFTSQGWLKGWNDGSIDKIGVGMDYFPNWPLENPVRYEAADGVAELFKGLEKLKIHVFPYTNTTIITGGNPWIRDKIGDRHFHAWRLWQRFYPEQCQDVVQRYSVTGIYEDCSWVIGRHIWGAPDGENWYNGNARMGLYFRQLLPEVAIMGERNNEVTCRRQQFALTITQWAGQAHPINSYIFEPFTRIWNLQLQPEGFDADDIRGFITPWPPYWEENPLQERLMLRKRGLVFAQEQLKSYWPEQWDPAVMHYFKGKDGAEFRFVRDHGTRFLHKTPKGDETIYWRLNGVQEAEAPTGGIEGWVGYDGNKIIGLNPRAVYITLEGVKRPPAVISAVPKGYAISRCVVRDGFWLACLDTLERLVRPLPRPDAPPEKAPPTTLCTLRVRGGDKPLSFCGVEAVTKIGANEYEVQVKLPGGFAAYWEAPAQVKMETALGIYPAQNTVFRLANGVISYYDAQVRDAQDSFPQRPGDVFSREEGTIPWLVTLPDTPAWLVFQYGSQHAYGDGANYMVNVNGTTRWKRYRPEQSPFPAEAEKHVSLPLKYGAVDLGDFAGKTVVIELASNGNYTGVSEAIRWHKPLLKDAPPRGAELDKPEEKPVEPGEDKIDL